MRILLTDEECFDIIDELDTTYQEDLAIIAKAQLKKDAYTLQAMAADGRCLEDIVKAMLKEAE